MRRGLPVRSPTQRPHPAASMGPPNVGADGADARKQRRAYTRSKTPAQDRSILNRPGGDLRRYQRTTQLELARPEKE